MIKYEWRNELDEAQAAELSDMLDRAAAYDAEPEYNVIDAADVKSAFAKRDSRFRHLLIWMLPHATAMSEPDQPERIAGLLRLELTDSATAKAVLVIEPTFRSIGITTLLLEQVGLDTTGREGWLGTGAHSIGAWARGNHPASGRLSNRFLIPRTDRMWKLIRPTDSPHDAAAAPVLESAQVWAVKHLEWAGSPSGVDEHHVLREAGAVAGVVSVNLKAVASEEFGRCATISHLAFSPAVDTSALRRLLDGAAALAHEGGMSGLIVNVDSGDSRLVNACRLVGFQHDRTDVRYEIGGSR
jgi:hypothetical protein